MKYFHIISSYLLIHILLINIISAGHVKYGEDFGERIWVVKDYPNRPCRYEEGYHKCVYRTGNLVCIAREIGLRYCQNWERLHCNDDEFQSHRGCVSRPAAVDFWNAATIYLPCRSDEYECKTTKKCIPRSWVQDGETDCSVGYISRGMGIDRSDETHFLQPCDEGTEYQCSGKMARCIPRQWVMDGKSDCPHGDDENTTITCHRDTEFLCATSKKCILRRYVNDGFSDCPNNDDEEVLNFTCIDRREFRCEYNLKANDTSFTRCIPRAWRRNAFEDCIGGTDEREAVPPDELNCFDDEFKCLDNTRCLPRKYLCDGIQNCRDGSDEVELCSSPTMYRAIKNGLDSPDRLMPWSFYLSHWDVEIEVKPDLMFGFKCYVSVEATSPGVIQRRTIPQCYIDNNSTSLCYNKEDVCFDSRGTFICARCLDGMVISTSQICDSIVDCKDLSDECPCAASQAAEVCEKIYPRPASQNSNIQERKSILDKVCNGVIDMEHEVDEKFCDEEVLTMERVGKITRISPGAEDFKCTPAHLIHNKDSNNETGSMFCDRVIDCPLMEDECSSKCLLNPLSLSSLEHIKYCFPFLRISSTLSPNTYGFHAYFNTSTIQTDASIVVDMPEKYNNSDLCRYACYVSFLNLIFVEEIRETKKGRDQCPLTGKYSKLDFLCDINGVRCPWIFICKSDKSKKVDISKRCDYKYDCADKSDEENCPGKTHFYCQNGNPMFIPRYKVADGRFDCSDRSDECKETAFSSSSQMLKNNFLRYFNWICAAFIILANSVVMRKHMRKMKSFSRVSVSYCNTLLLINLALSDVIFGLTLLMIAIKSFQFSGKYCEFDLEWRSGLTCNIIGIFTVISSQTSVNILMLMTAFNLYVTYWPFTPTRVHVNVLLLLCLLSWAASILLSTFPIWASDRFAHSFFIEPNAYLKDHIISRSQLDSYVKRTEEIIMFSNSGYISAREFRNESVLEKNDWYFSTASGRADFPNRHVDVKASFGFYSSSSVCLPDLYAHTSPASEYSLAIVLWNLFSLICIVLGYSLIFKRATKIRNCAATAEETRASEKQKKMLKRIIYIVLTDVICWLPVIAMTIASHRGYLLPEIVHAISAIVLLPINSLINPLIYSRLDKDIRQQVLKLFASICGRGNSEAASTIPAVRYHRVARPLTTVTHDTELHSEAETVRVLTKNTT